MPWRSATRLGPSSLPADSRDAGGRHGEGGVEGRHRQEEQALLPAAAGGDAAGGRGRLQGLHRLARLRRQTRASTRHGCLRLQPDRLPSAAPILCLQARRQRSSGFLSIRLGAHLQSQRGLARLRHLSPVSTRHECLGLQPDRLPPRAPTRCHPARRQSGLASSSTCHARSPRQDRHDQRQEVGTAPPRRPSPRAPGWQRGRSLCGSPRIPIFLERPHRTGSARRESTDRRNACLNRG